MKIGNPGARLPKVLMADCIRSADEGGSHGGAYLVDLEQGTSEKVLDWNDATIDWEGRGSKRGLRGIAFNGDEILIAASDEVFAFDREFRIRHSFRNRYLGYAHEIHLDRGTLYVTSTLYDSILALDLASGAFTRAWLFRVAFDQATNQAIPSISAYDPRSDSGPAAGDTVHLNSVWIDQERMFFSGLRPPYLLCMDNGGTVRKYADIPTWTHNARPFRGGVLCNSTGKDSICFLDLKGNVLKEFPVVRYPESTLTHVPAGTDIARQAFGRGLIATDDGLIIGSSSPSTISVYDFESGSLIKSVNITMDVRNAPHGLALWPY